MRGGGGKGLGGVWRKKGREEDGEEKNVTGEWEKEMNTREKWVMRCRTMKRKAEEDKESNTAFLSISSVTYHNSPFCPPLPQGGL